MHYVDNFPKALLGGKEGSGNALNFEAVQLLNDVGPHEDHVTQLLAFSKWLLPVEQHKFPAVLKDKNSKWKVVSMLQKAIRRGHVVNALKACTALWDDDPYYVMRRLGIISMEDVGPANPLLCYYAVMWAGATRLAKDMAIGSFAVEGSGNKYVALALAELMALSVKSRSACELNNWSFRPASAKAFAEVDKVKFADRLNSEEGLKFRELPVLYNVVRERRLESRTKWMDDFLSDDLRDDPSVGLMNDIGMMAMAMNMEGLDTAMISLSVFNAMKERTEMDEVLVLQHKMDEVEDYIMLEGIPSYAIDHHCFEGKKSIGYFKKASPVFEQFAAMYLSFVGEEKCKELLAKVTYSSIFCVETQLLNSYVVSWSKETESTVEEEAFVQEWSFYGMTPQQGVELYGLMKTGLADLNYARKKIMENPR